MSGKHINLEGQFQSDKYPTCPPGKVPLSVNDRTAQDLLWEYARRRRVVDLDFSDDLEACLLEAGYTPPGDEIDLEGYVDSKGIRYFGKARRSVGDGEGVYRCLADVGGALCLVELKVTPKVPEFVQLPQGFTVGVDMGSTCSCSTVAPDEPPENHDHECPMHDHRRTAEGSISPFCQCSNCRP